MSSGSHNALREIGGPLSLQRIVHPKEIAPVHDEPRDPKPPRRRSVSPGAGLAIGAGVGTALFAATGSPVWIALGAAIGVALGAAAQRHEAVAAHGPIPRRSPSRTEKRHSDETCAAAGYRGDQMPEAVRESITP